jgi:hypothetical protein
MEIVSWKLKHQHQQRRHQQIPDLYQAQQMLESPKDLGTRLLLG